MSNETMPLLSIACPVYNHEPYLRQALDGILMQRVNFPIEVVIGEDCSKDGSREILKEYEAKYPGFFTMLYREKNMGMSPNNADILKHCRGKYVAYLECDDYWTDPDKLQIQVDYMESHPDTMACYHLVEVVGHDGQPTGESYPECHAETYDLRQYRSEILPGQTSTRVKVRELDFNQSVSKLGLVPGDRVTAYLLASHGKVHCIQKKMGAYRHVTNQGSSYSATTKHNAYQTSLFMANYYKTMFLNERMVGAPAQARKTLEQMHLWRVTVAVLRGKGQPDRPNWVQAAKELEFKWEAVGYCALRLIKLPIQKVCRKLSGKKDLQ